MSRSPTDTHGRVSHNVCLFQENSGYRKRLRKAGQKEARPVTQPMTFALCLYWLCRSHQHSPYSSKDFGTTLTRDRMIVITAQGSWPCGQYYRGGNSDALTTAPTDSSLTATWDCSTLIPSWGRGPVLSMATFGWSVVALRPQKP